MRDFWWFWLPLFLVLAFILLSCGKGPVLEAGIYDMVLITTEDTCGLRNNDLLTPSWYVDYVGDYYAVKHTQNDATISGEFDGEYIVMQKTEWDEVDGCEYTINNEVIIDPYGESFVGTMTDEYVACDGDICTIVWALEGLKRKGTDEHGIY